jgi:hypothetical protein
MGVLIVFLLMTTSVGASVDYSNQSKNPQNVAGRKMTPAQALKVLSQELKAHIFIMGNLENKGVVLDLENRSAMENLKALLRGYSYATVFNIPPYSYSLIIETASGGFNILSNAPDWSASAVLAERESDLIPEARKANESTAITAISGSATSNYHSYKTRRIKFSPPQKTPAHEKAELFSSSVKQQRMPVAIDRNSQPSTHSNEPDVSGSIAGGADSIRQRIENAIAQQQSSSDGMRAALLAQINAIQAQIDSGEADRLYDNWSQSRDPRFIYNHYEKLDYYQKKLDELDR